jgi:hypothetical protein
MDSTDDNLDDNVATKDEDNVIGELETALGDLKLSQRLPRRLVVLDLNGLLLYRILLGKSKSVPDEHIKTAEKVNKFYAWRRPHVDEFLDFMFDSFAVAVWSSAMMHNTTKLIDFVFGGRRRKLVFEWDQRRCDEVQHPNPNEKKPLFLKRLSKVWAAFPEWNETNTLLVDDTPAKARDNPPHLIYSPPEWTILSDRGDDDLGPEGAIYCYLRELRDWHGNVCDFVKTKLKE